MDGIVLVLIGMVIGTGISIAVVMYYMLPFTKTFFHPHTRKTAKELRDMGFDLPSCPDGVKPMFISDAGLVVRWYGTLVGYVSYKIHGKDGYDPTEMKYDGLRANKPMKMAIDYEYRMGDDELWVSLPDGDFKEIIRAAGDMG